GAPPPDATPPAPGRRSRPRRAPRAAFARPCVCWSSRASGSPSSPCPRGSSDDGARIASDRARRRGGLPVMRIAVLIPAYQAEPHLAGVLARLAALAERPETLVVDDGSTDGTAAAAGGAAGAGRGA